MTTALLPRASASLTSAENREYAAQAVEAFVEGARKYAEPAHAANTRRAYTVGWNDFAAYCSGHSLHALPASPQTVTLYVTALAERAKLATIRQYLAAIAHKHRKSG